MSKQNNTKFFFRANYFDCPKDVYFPSEDSYFLAENISIEKNKTVIDVGCGSGIQSLNALMQGASKVVALDLNEKAIEATKKNCKKENFGEEIQTLKSNLFENYSGEKADVIIFNPPYIVTDEIKYIDLDGGKNGRETLNRFLEQFPKHLKKGGMCYFIQTDINGYRQTEKTLRKNGFRFNIIAKKKGFFEELAVYCCTN